MEPSEVEGTCRPLHDLAKEELTVLQMSPSIGPFDILQCLPRNCLWPNRPSARRVYGGR